MENVTAVNALRLPDPADPATVLLVDLDGTVTDSFPGISASFAHAVAALGAPVKAVGIPTGRFEFGDRAGGMVDLAIPISGPKGSGTVYVSGNSDFDGWTYSRLEIQIDGGERFDLQAIPK